MNANINNQTDGTKNSEKLFSERSARFLEYLLSGPQRLCVPVHPFRFHDLRHTAASLLLNKGITAITISRRLGRTKASITLDVYEHLIPGIQSEVEDSIDDLVMPVAVQLDEKVEPD